MEESASDRARVAEYMPSSSTQLEEMHRRKATEPGVVLSRISSSAAEFARALSVALSTNSTVGNESLTCLQQRPHFNEEKRQWKSGRSAFYPTLSTDFLSAMLQGASHTSVILQALIAFTERDKRARWVIQAAADHSGNGVFHFLRPTVQGQVNRLRSSAHFAKIALPKRKAAPYDFRLSLSDHEQNAKEVTVLPQQLRTSTSLDVKHQLYMTRAGAGSVRGTSAVFTMGDAVKRYRVLWPIDRL